MTAAELQALAAQETSRDPRIPRPGGTAPTRAVEAVLKYAHRLDQDGHAMTCADDAVKRTVGTHLRREARKINKAIEDALNP